MRFKPVAPDVRRGTGRHWGPIPLLTSGAALFIALSASCASAEEFPGLLVRASDDSRTVWFDSPTVSFSLQREQSIHPQLRPAFNAEWSGRIKILEAGRYTFRADARVLLNGTEAQNRPVDLRAGNTEIRVIYARAPDTAARLQLRWESDAFPPEPVPGRVLYHESEPLDLQKSKEVDAGRALAAEYNCVACHATEHPFLQSRPAPDLSFIGSRASTNWIYRWLEHPQRFRVSALMPAIPLSTGERADLAAYLGGLKDTGLRTRTVSARNGQQGEVLFKTVGCVACHGTNGVSLAGLGSKYSIASLAEYLVDPLAVDPSGRMPNVLLARAEADALAAYLITSRNAEFEAAAPRGNPDHGRALLVERGCVNCHSVSGVAPTLRAPALNRVKFGQGCLAELPPANVPHFAFTRAQRASIKAWLEQMDVSEAPAVEVFRIVESMNCRKCHEYYRPAELTLSANQAAPPLSEAGYKLRRSWLDAVLNRKKRVRPWMGLRMPHFGSNNVHRLLDYLHAQAGSELGEGATIPQPTLEEIHAGSQLLGRGDGGLSCINCHDFHGQPSGGEMRGPDMTGMYARIRVDWLRRFLHDPQRILPSTSMPSYFTGFPRDQSGAQITKIIQGLAGGKNMPIPPGLAETAQPFYLLVKNEPIVFRSFIQGSSPRSIAVGLPGLNSYVFDAQLCRLRYAWTGDFLDVKPVWADRGGGEAKILGQKYFTAHDTYPIRIGDPDSTPKVKFRGYKLIDGVPEFMYEVDGTPVRELISGMPNGLRREFVIARDGWFVCPETQDVQITTSQGPLRNERAQIPAGRKFEVSITKR